ncbi:MAG: methyltransferase domain-containing protein [Phycisphaeraceae bacterium]|nr:MAG: methyltransferase domain-containing protein [Phycisphaeraceae bacterium]
MSTKLGPIGRLMKMIHGPIYEARLRELVRRITPHLREGDRALDVGCGVGTLGVALMEGEQAPTGLIVEGLERHRRGGEPITVHSYQGGVMPFEDDAYDVVILADVLHHAPEHDQLLAECARVAKRLLIIKDHQRAGLLAWPRIALIDWAANAPYGVSCLFRYHTPSEWSEIERRHGLEPIERIERMRLYPFGWNLLFAGRLQRLCILEPHGAAGQNGAATGPVSERNEAAAST